MNPTPSQIAGAAIRDTVDVAAPPAAHAVQRARFVEAGERPPARGRVLWSACAVAAVLVAIAIVFGVRGRSHDSAVTFRVGPDQAPGAIGEFVTPAAGQDLSLQFSEGSTIVLEQGAHGRVLATTPRGASLVLEAGRARFDVVHRVRSEWTVAAGPYTVAVTGTSFDVNWIAASATIEVHVSHGSVVVRGPGAESGVEVKDGRKFVGTASARLEERPATAVSDLPLIASADPSAAPVVAGDAGAPVASLPSVSWSELAAKGEYKQIIADAESRGVDSAIASAGEGDLSTLADAARFTGRGEIARTALTALRTRFPRSARATSAAFLLGRMSEDAGNMRAAIGWYDSYLAEAPGGALAAEAMGRRMVALRRAGQTGEARRAAEAYLARFPKGSYAGVAREMVAP